MKERRLRSRYLSFSFSAFLSLFCYCLSSQVDIQLVDLNNTPIPEVTVKNLNKGIFEITDAAGFVSFNDRFEHTDIISCSHISFETSSITYKELLENDQIIRLQKKEKTIDEVLLIGRNEKVKAGTLLPLEIIDAKTIAKLQVQTPADLLEKAASVFVQRSQLGGGSPVVRGFEANKVLLVLDGVRMNNAIYRNGHLQSAITIDEQVLSSVDVLFGPGSIIYGSDAIGGVVHFRSIEPSLSESFEHKSNILTRYASASQEKTIHANYTFSDQKQSGLLSITHSDFSDLVAGSNRPDKYPTFGTRPDYVFSSNNPGSDILSDSIIVNDSPSKQIGSGYSQTDLLAKYRLQVNDHLKLTLNTQYSTSSNIPRYDQLIERSGSRLKFAEWYYGPQNRLLISPRLSLNKPNVVFDEMDIIAAYQFLEEDRINRRVGSIDKVENYEDLSVYSLTVDLKKRFRNINLAYGLDVQHNTLQSTSSDNTFTRYPNGDNRMSLFGLYSKIELALTKTLNLETGIRFSSSMVSIAYEDDGFFDWPEFFYSGIDNTTRNFSFLSALNIDLGLFKFNIIGGTAFRAPNIDDLGKTRVNADEIVIPNPDLAPEKTTNLELQAQLGNKKNYMSGSVFIVKLKDAIVRESFLLPDGSNIFVSQGDSLRVAANVNANKATVSGFTIRGQYKLLSSLTLSGSISITRGRINNEDGSDSPLGHIPPTFGKLVADFDHGNFNHQIRYNFNASKPITEFGGSVDNPELATPEGSLSWQTLNYYGSFQVSERLGLNCGVENILDLHYRPFSSGISAPGRNFVASLRLSLF